MKSLRLQWCMTRWLGAIMNSSLSIPARGVATTTTATSAAAGAPSGNLSAEMQMKGFTHATPHFSPDLADVKADLTADITSTPAINACIADLRGPWLVMTEDLQGEMFVEEDGTVFYRPANGLGHGIGKMELTTAGEVGTAFSMELETYTYAQTAALSDTYGLRFSVFGMVNHVHSPANNYRTQSLSGVWSKLDKNKTDNNNNNKEKESGSVGEEKQGPFNAAKLSPWEPSSAPPPWEPNPELMAVFQQVFPEPLQLTSHLRRAEAAAAAAAAASSASPNTPSSTDAPSGPFHLNLEDYAVGSIPGIYYIPNYLTPEESAQIVERVRTTPAELKSNIKKRTVQEWGCSMCPTCNKSFVSDANLPPWVQACTDMLVYDGIFTPSSFPNSVRIHEYQCGEGIGPHCDGPIYIPVVSVLSLASTSVMNFFPRREPYMDEPMNHYNDTFKFAEGDIGQQQPVQRVVMEPGSLLVFSGSAYYYHPHGVSDQPVEDLRGDVPVANRHFLSDPNLMEVQRTYRVSITTRNLLSRCAHQPNRAEYFMKRAWHLYHQQPVPEPLFPAPSVPATTTSTTMPPPSSSPSPSSGAVRRQGSGPLSTEELHQWNAKLDRVMVQQQELKEMMEMQMQQIVVSNDKFQKEVSLVLNHLSSAVLEMQAKMDDLIEDCGTQK